MYQRKWFIALVVSAFAIFVLGFGVNAKEDTEESEITVEYESYEDILEEIQTESGTVLYLSSVENVEGIYQVLYQDAETLQETIEDRESAISPRIVVSVQKEVIIYYDTFDEVPNSIYYEEFNDEYRTWMKGTLYVDSVVKSGSRYKATFKGSLVGTI